MTENPLRPRLNTKTGVGLLLPWAILQGIVFAAGLGIADYRESETISTMTGAFMVANTAVACWSAYIQGWRHAAIEARREK
jgi:hypothetical protein